MTQKTQALTDLFIDIHHRMYRYDMILHEKDPNKLDQHCGQGKVIATLMENGPTTQHQLSRLLDLRTQNIYEIMQKLENAGYVTRRGSSDDRRTFLVELTDEGKNLQFWHPNYTELFSCLEADEQKNLQKYLLKIADKLTEEIKVNRQAPKKRPYKRRTRKQYD